MKVIKKEPKDGFVAIKERPVERLYAAFAIEIFLLVEASLH